jgi:Domain of unknown function (DUF6268)
MEINNAHGLRLSAEIPLVARPSFTLHLGASYYETKLNFKRPSLIEAFGQTLADRGLRSTGLTLTACKPFVGKNFLLFLGNADLNGNFSWNNLPEGNYFTFSALAVFGRKWNERVQSGLGLARTYRFGEIKYVPVLLLSHSFNDRWGIEFLLPMRAHLRRTFSARSLAMLGCELEGNLYFITSQIDSPLGQRLNERALRRQEIRLRLLYERALYKAVWLSGQVGWRYNGNFSIGDWGLDYQLGHPLYVGFSLNLVNPAR